jgi:predicted alpha/beta hydrolase family esterase
VKVADVDIVMVPGWTNAGPEHWMTRWEAKLSTARRVMQANWDQPIAAEWADVVVRAVTEATRPVVLVAHSCGVPTIAYALPNLDVAKVAGAFLVAPPSEAFSAGEVALASFIPYPKRVFPFPAALIASRTDPACTFVEAEALAATWGAALVDAGDAGYINTASGHGPWPEGLMRFAGFMKALSAAR